MATNPLHEVAMRTAAAYSRGDLEAWSSSYSPDYIHHNLYQPDVTNIQTYKQLHTGFRGVFPDLELIVDGLLTQGTLDSGSVAMRYHLQGTGTGNWLGADVTGKTVAFSCVLFTTVTDGMIVEAWEFVDYLAFYMQIGQIPMPSASASPA